LFGADSHISISLSFAPGAIFSGKSEARAADETTRTRWVAGVDDAPETAGIVECNDAIAAATGSSATTGFSRAEASKRCSRSRLSLSAARAAAAAEAAIPADFTCWSAGLSLPLTI